MLKTARIQIRVEPSLKARLEIEADRRGQKLTTFVERALESALEGLGPDQSTSGDRTGAPATAASLPDRPAPTRPPAACPECGAVGRMHQRGCKRA